MHIWKCKVLMEESESSCSYSPRSTAISKSKLSEKNSYSTLFNHTYVWITGPGMGTRPWHCGRVMGRVLGAYTSGALSNHPRAQHGLGTAAGYLTCTAWHSCGATRGI